MTTLFVAAGGGGDAVGTLLAHRLLAESSETPLITTCAWERLRIDPVPGPRPRSGFRGLGMLGGRQAEVLVQSDTVPPGRSALPRLVADSSARVFVHDLDEGVRGLTGQLVEMASALDASRLVVVDVGGDVMAEGPEPALLSPLADSLTLAAALQTGLPTTLAVVGPGADAELSPDSVTARMLAVGGSRAGHITPADAESSQQVLQWHPTEASALVAAAALGVRGAVAMRRGGTPTPITDTSASVWTVEGPSLKDFPLAHALIATQTISQAEQVMRDLAVNELDYERQRATSPTTSPEPQPLRAVVDMALRAGATHITTRHLAELTGAAGADAAAVITRPAGLGLWPLAELASLDVCDI